MARRRPPARFHRRFAAASALSDRTGPSESRGTSILPARKKRHAGAFSCREARPQTTASSFSFFGLMNCSRDTPSHITSGLATSTDE